MTNQQVAAELQSKVDAARARYTNNPSRNNKDSLINAERDLGNAKRKRGQIYFYYSNFGSWRRTDLAFM
ncbi:hypothetical protein DMX07_26145 [Pseudomonas soli]|uniref:Uncharacterized protein n=1 Tax=Pseudomonas soli TaxID=1306993 RepID=A0A2V4H7F6_9PSED|nr:hypothetical protein DMX07_26145 [Pseudomonas soli]